MPTAQAFNGMLYQFVEELQQAFPREQALSECLKGLPVLAKMSPTQPMQKFLEIAQPHADLIHAKDPELFRRMPALCNTVNVAKLYEQADKDTRDNIWQYLQTLYFMASTMSSMPPEVLSTIEELVGSCTEKIESGSLKLEDLIGTLPALLGNLIE